VAIPVWAVGQVLAAADVNNWFIPIAAVKPADTGRNTNIVPSNDPDLQFQVAANASYDLTAVVQYKGGTNGASDAQFQINVPGSTTGFVLAYRLTISGLTLSALAVAFGTAFNAGTNGTGNNLPLLIKASLSTAGTAGTVALAWSQNTSSGTNTTVMAGSVLTVQRIG